MKKYIALLVILIWVVGNVYCKVNDLSVPKINRTEQAQLEKYQKQIDRENELKKRLQDPTIIKSAFRQVGKIISLEGGAVYYKSINDKLFNKITLRELTIDFKYSYGIGIGSLEYLKVTEIKDETIFISIPKNRIQLLYIQQDIESKLNSDKIFLLKDFSPSDIQIIYEIAQQQTVNSIGADQKVFNDAMINLQKAVEKLTKKFGYKQVIFDVV